MEPALFDSIQATPGQRIRVGVWLKLRPKEVQASERSRGEEEAPAPRLLRSQRRDILRLEYQAINQAFVNGIANQDYEILRISNTAPVVFVETTPTLLNSLQSLDNIDFIYLPKEGRDLINTAVPTVGSNTWPNTEFEGDGVPDCLRRG